MNKKPVVAILADFPYWVLDASVPHPSGHYAVWLVALHEALKSVPTYEIHWICFCKGLRRALETQHANQIFHVLPAGSLELASRTHYVWDRFRVRRILNRLKPDLVHAWGTENRYAACAQQFRGKKILSMQGILTAYHRLCPLGEFMRRQSEMEPRLLPMFDVVTAESEWGCERCLEIAPKCRVVRWEYAAEERFFDVVHELAPKPTCLMAGTDSPIKNVETAIEAFSDSSMAHVTLLLAGVDAAQRTNLPPNILALGRVSRERMTELLASSWALVHPTLADTSPNIVKEARVVGLPVVTTHECGGKQYVQEGKSGYVIDPRDVEGLRQAVLNMTSSAEHARGMGVWQQEACRRQLSRETMIKGLLKIYETLLQS